MRILIVDDNALVRKALAGVLESRPGWKVCGEAETGQEASSKAVQLRPDLIILDYLMPGMDGLATAERLNASIPGVPVIMYTLFLTPQLEAQARQIGVRHVVSKADPLPLLRVIESTVHQSGAQPLTDSTSLLRRRMAGSGRSSD